MIICGTGHRPNKLGGYGEDVYVRLRTLAREWLSKNQVDKVISGVALGWDQALAAAAWYEKIPFIAAVPFSGQESKWPSQSQYRYRKILEVASEVVIVCDGGYSAHKMQLRNEWMVDHCDQVLALWDGSLGGTGNCIQYANKVHKEIVNLWTEYSKK